MGDRSGPVVPGTVARGELRIDELLYTGKVNGEEADTFPFPITRERIWSAASSATTFIARPATTIPAAGTGMIVQRGFPPPPSYHIDRLRQAPVGHFFDVMTNGFGAMYSYASRIEPEDRWRIAAYIRALQLSRARDD